LEHGQFSRAFGRPEVVVRQQLVTFEGGVIVFGDDYRPHINECSQNLKNEISRIRPTPLPVPRAETRSSAIKSK